MARVRDPLALAVRHAVGEILDRSAPYSSARITSGTVHRTSWPIRVSGVEFKRYPSDDQISLREYKLINKYVANIHEKVARAIVVKGFNVCKMSDVTISWHFGSGLYLNVRVELEYDP